MDCYFKFARQICFGANHIARGDRVRLLGYSCDLDDVRSLARTSTRASVGQCSQDRPTMATASTSGSSTQYPTAEGIVLALCGAIRRVREGRQQLPSDSSDDANDFNSVLQTKCSQFQRQRAQDPNEQCRRM